MKTTFTKAISAALVCLLLAGLVSCSEAKNNNSVSPSDASTSYYRSLLLNYDYGEDTTYVIGHKSPDADTVGSAVAYANLLN